MADLAATLQAEGAVRLFGLVREKLGEWDAVTKAFFDLNRPGHRIASCTPLAKLAEGIAESPAFTRTAGTGWACVRAIAFNKTPDANWALGWHQDRTIAVARREDVPGFDVWSTKDGVVHVEPPVALLEGMVTLRLHLDRVVGDNAPLLIAKGSHRLGKVAERAIQSVVDASEIGTCLADPGDGWLYATPVLHASARSTSERERRVIHLDFSRDSLPAPLEWAGIG